jgi:cytoskeleton protein RodZ
MLASPAAWGVLAIVVLTAVVWVMPQHWFAGLQSASSGASAPAPAASARVSSTVVPMPVPEQTTASSAAAASAPAMPAAVEPVSAPVAASGVSAAPAPAAALRVRAAAPSWIEVHDARAQVLLSRVVEPGEAVDLDGAMPLRVKIGNARATQVEFRGRALDLAPSTRDNVARLELK